MNRPLLLGTRTLRPPYLRNFVGINAIFFVTLLKNAFNLLIVPVSVCKPY